ncbi:MAG: TonB-dependent receptor [Bacteroidetes bacterium]|nr:TonB-dependent receptor [Bacteroidota bacterium]
MKRRVRIFFLLLTTTAFPALAQSPGSISGFVRDAQTGETLLFANVYLSATSYGAATNTYGFYVIAGIPAGEYDLTVSYLGFETHTQQVTIEENRNLRIELELTPLSVDFGAVTVVADRLEAEDARQISLAKLPAARIANLPSILEPDVFRSLQLLPGIKAASDYSSGLYIRGGTPDQTLILLDATTVYNPSHFFGFFSTFNADALKDVRVYKGGYPAEYGGRIGSVVDLYNKDGNRRKTSGRLSLGILASRVLLEGPYSKGSWMIAFRRTTLEPLLSALQNQDIQGIPNQFYFYDLNAKINLDLSPDDKISIAAYAGRDFLDIEVIEDTDILLEYGNRTLSARWTHILSETAFSGITLTSSRYFSDPRFSIAGTKVTRDNTVDDFSIKADLELLFNRNHSLKLGTWTGLFKLRLLDRFDNLDSFSERINTGYGSAYAQHTFLAGSGMTLTSGLRASYFGNGQYFRIEPRFSADYQLRETVRLQISAGRYHQFLTLISNEAFSGFDVWLTTADGVPPSYGDQLVGGVKWSLPRGYKLDIEGYYRTMTALFELDPFVGDPAGLEYEEFFHFGSGWASGLEVFLERSTGRLNGFLGYTFSVTRRQFPTLNDNRPYPPKYDRTHDVKLVTNFELGRNWRTTAAWSYATGQAYTEPASRYRLNDFPFGSEPINAIVSPFNRARLPAYHRLDVGFDKRGRFFGFADYTFRLQVLNAYARNNTWFYFFEFEDDDTVDRTTVPQIPVPIPNLSLTLDF